MTGVWLLGGTLGGYIIRKPGAALFVELVAATVSMGLGSQWAVETLYSGLAQGIGAEIVFALLAYRRFNVWVAAAAGALSFVCEWVLELVPLRPPREGSALQRHLLGVRCGLGHRFGRRPRVGADERAGKDGRVGPFRLGTRSA